MGRPLEDALAAIDRANAADPTAVEVGGEEVPAALLYGRRMSARLEAFAPGASDALRVACRAQHLERWTLPRATYPEGRAGYLRWRREAARRHAARAAELLAEVGWAPGAIDRASALVAKRGLGRDREAQTLEDVACLVFLEHYAEAFFAGRERSSVLAIARKTAAKMSPRPSRPSPTSRSPKGSARCSRR